MREKLIEVPLTKGCTLLLTESEYIQAIRRGKAVKRAKKLRARLEQKYERSFEK